MLITCKCLNVSIQLGKSRPKGIHLSSLNLSSLEKSAPFFTEGVAEVDGDVVVNKQVESLVVSQAVGNWTIDSCINCSLTFFGQHKEKKRPPLISAGLISDPNTIQMLKNHPDYSPVFRIVIAPEHEGKIGLPIPDEPTQIVQTAISGLQQKFNVAVQKQGAKTDENIRIYSEEQYELLGKFRERASRDHKALVRLIYNLTPAAGVSPKKSAVIKNSTSPAKGVGTQALNSVINSTPRTKSSPISAAMNTPGHRTATRSMSLFSPSRGGGESFDSEGVFNLEGMEESSPDLGASEGESDTDHDDSGSHDEGIDLHRKKSNALHLARSLPVNVPVFVPGDLQMQAIDIDQDLMEPQDPQDIAASIKALARSVHGDAVFGDLPRPRFSTQI